MSRATKYHYSIVSFLIILGIGELVFWGIVFLLWQYISQNQPSFQFENKWFLYGLIILIPLLIGSYLYLKIWRNKTIIKYAEHQLLPHLTAGYSNNKALLKDNYICLCLFFDG